MDNIKTRQPAPMPILGKDKKSLSKEQFNAAMEQGSMAIYKCRMGTGSNFQEGVRYLKQRPEMLDRL